MADTITIPLSKNKLFLMFAGSLLFAGIGTWWVIQPPEIQNPLLRDKTLLRVVGVTALLLFGGIGCFLFRKLGDRSPGLVLSDLGILDNTSGISAGFVPWSDIVDLSEYQVAGQTLMMLVVKNPQEYIDKQQSAFKRKLMQINHDTYGAAISISANSLQCSHSELKTLLDESFAAYRKNSTE